MPKTDITLIAALFENNVVGVNGDITSRIAEPLQQYNRLEANQPVVMGKGTFLALGGKPLPDRKNIVVTSDKFFAKLDVVAVHNLEAAFCEILGHHKAYILGGQRVHEYFLPFAQTLEFTKIQDYLCRDCTFPDFNRADWNSVFLEEHLNNQPPFSFITYKRKNGIYNSSH